MSNIEFDSSIDDFSSVDSRRLNHQDCEGLFQVGKQSPDIVDGVRVDRDTLKTKKEGVFQRGPGRRAPRLCVGEQKNKRTYGKQEKF